jgi:hypothetical protein
VVTSSQLLVQGNITVSGASASFASLVVNTTTPTQKIHLKSAVGVENGTTGGATADQMIFGYAGSNLTQYNHKIQTGHDAQAALNRMDFLIADSSTTWKTPLQLRHDTVIVSGSLNVSGSLIVTGSIRGNLTGSMFGTASWANNVTSASFATTASAATSITFTPQSASFAATASFALNATTAAAGTVSSSLQFNSLTLPFTGSFTGSFVGTHTGSLFGTSSIATTSSYAVSASFAPTILPSGVVSSSGQVSYTGLSSIPANIVSSSAQVTTFLPTGTVSSSLQINTGSFSGSITSASFANTASAATSITFTPQSASFANTASAATSITFTPLTSSFAETSSAATSITFTPLTASFANTASAATSITFTPQSASFATSASYAPTQATVISSSAQIVAGIANQNVILGIVTSSQLLVQGNLTVLGSSSIQYVTSSQLNIGNNKIVLNTSTPAVQFGGISVVDSGSGQATGSLYWDSLSNRWISQRETGAAYNSAILIAGPKNVGNLGQELGLTTNNIPVVTDGIHLGDSQITDNGTTVSITNNLSVGTAITASIVTATSYSSSIANGVGYFGTSSFATSASFAPTILPSGIVSSSLQINTGSFTGSFTGILSGSVFGTASNAISSSFATTASAATSITFTPLTASFANTASAATSITFTPLTASFALNSDLLDNRNSTTYASTGSNIFVGTQIITGSVIVTGSAQASYIDIDTTAVVGGAVGRLVWNDGDGTLDLGLKGGNTTLQIGQELVARAYNAEATTLTDGTVVYISGSQGNRIAVRRASATAELGSSNTLGVVTEPILSGEEGFVTVVGVVRGLNTIGLTPGAILWLSASAGQYTQTRPEAPYHGVQIGYVERVHASVGAIYVKVDNGYELDELHDVNVSGSSYGDLLVKSGSIWINSKQLTGSYGITGSLNVTNQIIGTLIGTASWASNAISSSFATTASFANTASAATSITFTPLTASFANTASAATSITFTPSTASFATSASYALSASYAPGGVIVVDTHTFTGDGIVSNYTLGKAYDISSVTVTVGGLTQTSTTHYTLTGTNLSFLVAPPSQSSIFVRAIVNVSTGSVGSFSGSFTGILLATNVLSSSFATTASAATSITFTPQSASFATSASFAPTILPAGIVSSSEQINTGSFTGSFIGTHSGSTFGTASRAESSSYALYAGFAEQSITTIAVTNNGASYYLLDGVVKPVVTFVPGTTYRFDTSGVVGSHPFRFSLTANGPTEYTYGVTVGANYTEIDVNYATSASLFYYCTFHSGMGNQANTLRSENLITASQTGSMSVLSSSYASTASVATSSSFATSASYAPTILPTGTISSSVQVQLNELTGTTFSASNFTFPQNLTVAGTLVAQEFITEYVSSSVIYESGSTKFGDTFDDTHQFTGSVLISGSGVVIGSFTASEISSNFTGSLFGTASFANTASAATSITFTPLTSSFAETSSAATSITFTPLTSSFATTASNIVGGTTRYIPLWANATSLSSSVLFQSASNLGINTTTPSASFHVVGTMMMQGVIEQVKITASAPPSTLNVDALSGSVVFLSASSANNWTVNFRGSAATSLNSMMYPGQSMTFAVLVNHATVGYTASIHQVDGTTIMPRWQGGTLPSGSGTSTDIYSYTLIKTANAAFNIFAAQTKFA